MNTWLTKQTNTQQANGRDTNKLLDNSNLTIAKFKQDIA